MYRTTPDFLRTFGLQSLEELPEIESAGGVEGKQTQITMEEQLEQTL